jgi:hypothetical protein
VIRFTIYDECLYRCIIFLTPELAVIERKTYNPYWVISIDISLSLAIPTTKHTIQPRPIILKVTARGPTHTLGCILLPKTYPTIIGANKFRFHTFDTPPSQEPTKTSIMLIKAACNWLVLEIGNKNCCQRDANTSFFPASFSFNERPPNGNSIIQRPCAKNYNKEEQ